MRELQPDAGAADDAAAHRRAPVRTLSRAYLVGLTFIIGQLIVAQLLVHTYQANQASDTHVVNIAGRQQYLAQRIALLATILRQGDGISDDTLVSDLRYTVAIWRDTQVALRRGDASLGLDLNVKQATEGIYSNIEPNHLAIVNAAEDILSQPHDSHRVAANVERILAEQGPYVEGMRWIGLNYTAHAGERIERLRTLESLLIASVLLVILVQALLLFRPLFQRVTAAMDAHRRMELLLVEVRDRERRRIGADLHDGLCQVLVGVSCILKAMQPKLSESLARQTDEARGFVDDAIAQTRALARGLYPVEVEVNGLAAALETLAHGVKTAYGVDCHVVVDREGTRSLLPNEALQLYYIAQEAVGNAARHSKSAAVEVALADRGGAIALEIRDQGTGFRTRDVSCAGHPGMGLRTMRLRAEIIGAQLDISAPRSGGTLVSCTLQIGDREVATEPDVALVPPPPPVGPVVEPAPAKRRSFG